MWWVGNSSFPAQNTVGKKVPLVSLDDRSGRIGATLSILLFSEGNEGVPHLVWIEFQGRGDLEE